MGANTGNPFVDPAALALVVYLPAGNLIAKTVPLSALQVLLALGLAMAATLWWELVKLIGWSVKTQTKGLNESV